MIFDPRFKCIFYPRLVSFPVSQECQKVHTVILDSMDTRIHAIYKIVHELIPANREIYLFVCDHGVIATWFNSKAYTHEFISFCQYNKGKQVISLVKRWEEWKPVIEEFTHLVRSPMSESAPLNF